MIIKQSTTYSPLSNLLDEVYAICLSCMESSVLQDLLNNSLQRILVLFRAQRGSIFLLEPDTKDLTLKSAVGINNIDFKNIVAHLGEGIIGRVAQQKEPLLVEDIREFKDYKPRVDYKSFSFISAPLIIKERLIGVINICDKDTLKPFVDRELQVLYFLSSQIALNYHRIFMIQQLGNLNATASVLKKQMEAQEHFVSLGKLAAGIAHEFNNPLDGIMRYTNLCLRQSKNNEILQEYLTEIQKGLKRMANIVRDLLACARKSPGTGQKIDIHKAIEESLKEIYPYLVSRNINLVKNFTQELPEIPDWGAQRIISNLLNNAVDAIDHNGTIEINTALEENTIKIQVSDTGRGIASADLDKIFDPFFTTKDVDNGCGLGLTIVNEMVKYYNGEISVKSSLAQGTTFTVKLPINN